MQFSPHFVRCVCGQVLFRRRKSGFALLITITLLAFLVLLLVSLAALTRVETQVANNSQHLAQARQNALMALNIALGELQQAAGPDQRTTAPAALGENATAVMAANTSDNGLGAVVNGTRYWTGVWGNKRAPEEIFTAAPEPVLLRWLVSGNENSPAITVAGDGQITAPATAVVTEFTPAQAVAQDDGTALSDATAPTTTLRINGEPAALLLGAGTAGTHVTGYVAAPLVNIDSNQVAGLSGPVRVGRYAWWVGDEGVKAKYNLPDPYIANDTPDDDPAPTSRDSRYRLLAAQRNGIEAVSAFGGANYPVAATEADDALYLGVGNTLTPAGMRLTSSGVNTDGLKAHAHDLTTYSHGVLADSQFGGLRRDLTFHLDARSGDTFLDGRNILPDGATPVANFSGSKYTAAPSLFSETTANGGLGYTSLNLSPRLGPKWDQLKSFYQTAYDFPGDLEVRPAVDVDVDPVKVQAAITPVILETRTLFALSAGPTIETSLVLVLGNPYARPLKASTGLNFRITLHPNRYTTTQYYGEEMGLICNFVGPTPADPLLKRKISSVFTRRWGRESKNYPPGSGTPSVPPLQMDYVPPETFPNPHHNTGNTIFHHYYPIMKFPKRADSPQDPNPNEPGVLDEVVFQIPAGVLNLAPGETKAYQIDPSTSLPNEQIDGISMTVIPLREMEHSWDITYFKHTCHAAYVSDASVFSPGDVTGDSFFRAGLNITNDRGAWSVGWDYTLSVPGKPNSVLQTFGSLGHTQPDTLSNQMLPANEIPSQVFRAVPTPISGAIHRKAFRGPIVSNMDAAVYAERNQVGRAQRPGAGYNSGAGTNPWTAWPIIYTENEYVRTEGAFTDYLAPDTASQAAWGSGEQGNPMRLSPEGRLVLLDAPAAHDADEVPVLSLGQLQHADLTADDEALGVNSQPNHVVGSSWYNRLVSRESTRTAAMDNFSARRNSNWADTSPTAFGDSPRYPGFVPDLPKMTPVFRYDMSYLINAALWDETFFSTVRPASGSNGTRAPAPANRRLVYVDGVPTLGQLRGADASAVLPAPADLAVGENGRAPAAQMLVSGAFNVNSTSVEAWKAVLSGLRGLTLEGRTPDPEATPFARSIRQPGDPLGVLPTSPSTQEATYTGFRALTDDQVAQLAVQIVQQVKARGPFLSLSQFINRTLTVAAPAGSAIAETGLAGALQQAIDQAGINRNLNVGQSLKRNNSTVIYPDDAVMPTGDDSNLARHMGAPGWLTQGDVLQSLAPVLAARSDTFVIRAYGEVVDAVNSPAAPAPPLVSGRAWCEAVVQRMPDYVDPTVRATSSVSASGTTNRGFGRRFRVVSFRWLSPDDI